MKIDFNDDLVSEVLIETLKKAFPNKSSAEIASVVEKASPLAKAVLLTHHKVIGLVGSKS